MFVSSKNLKLHIQGPPFFCGEVSASLKCFANIGLANSGPRFNNIDTYLSVKMESENYFCIIAVYAYGQKEQSSIF